MLLSCLSLLLSDSFDELEELSRKFDNDDVESLCVEENELAESEELIQIVMNATSKLTITNYEQCHAFDNIRYLEKIWLETNKDRVLRRSLRTLDSCSNISLVSMVM